MIRQPSGSGERLGIRECAQLVESYMRDSGCQVAEICETKGNPVVFGELAAGARHTLIVYMMYDTQPFEGETWSHPPLEASLVPHEGFPSAVIGRGAINTKGPMVAFFNALLAVKESGETLPLNLKFVAEGEEELGSPPLPEFFRDNLALLRAAEAVYYPGASQDRNGRVKMYLGNKGILYLELVCSGARWGRGPQTHALLAAALGRPRGPRAQDARDPQGLEFVVGFAGKADDHIGRDAHIRDRRAGRRPRVL